MKYYIATKLENHAQHNKLRDQLAKLGHQITYDWTTHGPVYKSGLSRLSACARDEIEGVLAADVVVVLWPGGRGTHAELGAAIATKVRTIFVSDHEPHHEASPETCAFYHHPMVRRVRSMDAALTLIYHMTPKCSICGLSTYKSGDKAFLCDNGHYTFATALLKGREF